MHCVRDGGSFVYKTTNSGETWDDLGAMLSPNKKCGIEYSPESNIVYYGSIPIQYFKDDGTYTVRSIGNNSALHFDIRDFSFMGIDEYGKENMLIATDGGITLCKLDIQSYSAEKYNLNGNHLPICEFVGMGISHSSPEFIVAGAMHDNTFKYSNNQWNKFWFGDGGDCEVNWIDPDIYYYMGNSSMASSSGSSFSYYGPASWFIGMEYELHPNDPYLLYFGRGRVPGSNAIFGTYNEHTNQETTKQVPTEMNAVGAIGVNSNNEIYIADFGGNSAMQPNRFIKSLDDGDTWIDLSGSSVYTNENVYYSDLGLLIAWRTIEDIIFNPNDPNEIWISIGGIRANYGIPENGKFRVLHSTDGGNNWYDYSDNLSAFPLAH